MATKYDAIIIGTGQAGPSLAGRLAGAGMKVAIATAHARVDPSPSARGRVISRFSAPRPDGAGHAKLGGWLGYRVCGWDYCASACAWR